MNDDKQIETMNKENSKNVEENETDFGNTLNDDKREKVHAEALEVDKVQM